MGAWHNDTELGGDTLPPLQVHTLPVGKTTAAQAEQWADLHASRWRAQQAEAAERVIGGVQIDHVEPPRALGSLQGLQRGDYDQPPHRRWWGPNDISAPEADALAKAQNQMNADIDEGVDGTIRTLLWGVGVVLLTLLLFHLAMTYWPPVKVTP